MPSASGAEVRPYLAHLRARDIETLLVDVDEVRALLASRGWQVVNELIDDVHETALTRLLMSSAGSEGMVFEQAEYARLLGFLSGLRQTRWAANAYLLHAERAQAKES